MDFVTSREALRAHYKPAHDVALKKELASLDGHCRNFIARSPFVLIGSSDAAGNADVTPKGDRPGFVAILTTPRSPFPTGPATTGWTRWKTSPSTRRSGCSS